MGPANGLEIGNGGLVAPRPGDEQANPLAMAPQPAGPGPMAQQAGNKQDAAKAQFDKVKQASQQIASVRKGLEGLAALQDTVTMDDVVEEAGGLVAAGIPAIQVASTLADVPEQPSQIQAWLQEQLQKLAPQEAQIKAVLDQSGHRLATTALGSVLAHSAEAHFNKRLLASMPVQGNA